MSHLRLLARFLAAATLCLAAAAAAQAQKEPAKDHIAVEYDIRDLVEKPAAIGAGAPLFRMPGKPSGGPASRRDLYPAQIAAMIVQAIFSTFDKPQPIDPESIEVVNGTRLIIRTTKTNHVQIDSLLKGFRNFNDVSITATASLFEVDEEFYNRLKNAKPIDWEEQEERFLGRIKGNPSEGEILLGLLDKEKPVQTGDAVKVDDRSMAGLLSRHKVVSFLPNVEQVLKGEAGRQSILEGVAFVAGLRVSPDRRFVRFQFSEIATEVGEVKKVKVIVDAAGKRVDAEIPSVRETIHKRAFEIPDSAAMLVAVHFRPAALQEKKRAWVLRVQPRLRIESEERDIFLGILEPIHKDMKGGIAPRIVADVMTNPRLKGLRDFYGTTGDKRFALLNSLELAWPKDLKIDLAGHERTPAKRAGQRLLGIRIDKTEPHILVSLVNAGGTENGSAAGAALLRYTARLADKSWEVELAAEVEP